MILSGGGGKPCIHPITRGSDSAADRTRAWADTFDVVAAAIATPNTRVINLEIDDDIDEAS